LRSDETTSNVFGGNKFVSSDIGQPGNNTVISFSSPLKNVNIIRIIQTANPTEVVPWTIHEIHVFDEFQNELIDKTNWKLDASVSVYILNSNVIEKHQYRY
jgi:hypothetical protein